MDIKQRIEKIQQAEGWEDELILSGIYEWFEENLDEDQKISLENHLQSIATDIMLDTLGFEDTL